MSVTLEVNFKENEKLYINI